MAISWKDARTAQLAFGRARSIGVVVAKEMDVYTIGVYAYMARHEHGDGVVRLEDDLCPRLLYS